jgi:hypothetical protein
VCALIGAASIILRENAAQRNREELGEVTVIKPRRTVVTTRKINNLSVAARDGG